MKVNFSWIKTVDPSFLIDGGVEGMETDVFILENSNITTRLPIVLLANPC